MTCLCVAICVFTTSLVGCSVATRVTVSVRAGLTLFHTAVGSGSGFARVLRVVHCRCGHTCRSLFGRFRCALMAQYDIEDSLKLRFVINAMQGDDPFRSESTVPPDLQSALEWTSQRSPEAVRQEREAMLSRLEGIADKMWCVALSLLCFTSQWLGFLSR